MSGWCDATTLRIAALVAAGGLLFCAAFAAPAVAGEPASKCAARQLKAAGRYAQAGAACRSKAAKAGAPVDPECEPIASQKLASRLEKAGAGDDCLAVSQDDLIQLLADGFLADLGAVIEPPPAACCESGPSCLWVPDAKRCNQLNGTPGAPGTVCAPSGDCVPPPIAPGPCCEGLVLPVPGAGRVCVAGPFDILACASEGEAFLADAICHASGQCLR
jgi:hypothetical protein